MIRIGAQVYTVRNMLAADDEMRSAFFAIKEIGYDSVQLFGSADLIERCAKCGREAGLDIAGVLTNLNTCENEEKKLLALCSEYGISDIGVSTSFQECREPDGYITRLNAFAAKVKKAGLTFSYHNHGHEFIKLACGETAMDRFLKGFDAAAVDFMPDTYWLHDGGYDVRYFLEQTKNRVKILHLKDMKRTSEGHTFAELGNGNLYFPGIIKTAIACGIKHFVVEQDICEGNPVESLRQSYRYLTSLLEE